MILDVTRIGDEYRVRADSVSLRFRSLTPHHDGPSAIIEALDLTLGGKPHVDRLALLSSRTRATLAATLAKRWPGHAWSDILDDACFEVYRALSAGEPSEELVAEEPTPDAWLVDGLIPLDDITVLYADGGSLKSWFALALSVAALRNEPVAPSARWCVRKVDRVLYLDWETDKRTHARRLYRLCRGLAIDPIAGISYMNLRGRPLHTAIQSVTSEALKVGAGLSILDSLGMACGDEPETAQANLRTLGALSTLPGTKLVIAHVNAQTATQPQGPGRPYGSVFIRNTARSAIEARGEPEGAGSVLVTYYHRKANDSALSNPLAIRYAFSSINGPVTLYSTDPDLQHAPLVERLAGALKAGTQTVSWLSETLDVTANAVKLTLHRYPNRFINLGDDTVSGGKGRKALWGLVDGKRVV